MEPILARLRRLMGTPEPRVRTHNIVFVPVGSPPQALHCDDTLKEGVYRYFTLVENLDPLDSLCGGTELGE